MSRLIAAVLYLASAVNGNARTSDALMFKFGLRGREAVRDTLVSQAASIV
jgi:hypothetical protein